jgi:hypothetical protein
MGVWRELESLFLKSASGLSISQNLQKIRTVTTSTTRKGLYFIGAVELSKFVTGVMQRGFFGTIFHNIKYKATKSLEAFEVEAHGGGASRRGRKSKPSALTVY